MLPKWAYYQIDRVNKKFESEKKRIADLIEATKPVRRVTGHLKLIAAWKFIAALATNDLTACEMKIKVDSPSHSTKFRTAMKPILSHLMNGKMQIDSYVKKIS